MPLSGHTMKMFIYRASVHHLHMTDIEGTRKCTDVIYLNMILSTNKSKEDKMRCLKRTL